jgi:hypothetical protein
MDPNIPVEDDEEAEEGSLGPKRWSKDLDEDEPPTVFDESPTCFLFSIIVHNHFTCKLSLSANEQNYSMIVIS